MEVQNGVIGNYADWLLYPAQVCGILMPAIPERANVADAVWTANNFQATYAEEDSEIAPLPSSFDMQWRARRSGASGCNK